MMYHPGSDWRRAMGGLALLAGSGVVVVASGSPTHGAGFALREQSATSLGNAFSGATAAAEDITFAFFNPAGLTRQSGNQTAAVGSGIFPRARFKFIDGSTAAGVPITGSDGSRDAARDAFVPAAYALWDVDPRWKLAIAVNAPFGLETKYDTDWVGRYHALRSRLRTITATPTAAFKVDDWLSLGAGLQIQYIDARLTNAIDFGTIGAAAGIAGAVPTQQDGIADLDASDIGLGFTVGVLVEPWQGTRFGVGYRSRIHHTFEGDADFAYDSAGIARTINAATGLFADGGFTVDLTTPDSVSIGAYHEINDRWAVMAEAAWTNWSLFRELRVQFDNPADPDNVTAEDWEDSWFFAAGTTYRVSDGWTLRAGVAHDRSPIPADRRTPRVPGNDRTWISVGGSYRATSALEFAFGYTHIFVADGDVELSVNDPGNLFRGSLTGKTEAAIDLVSAQVLLRF